MTTYNFLLTQDIWSMLGNDVWVLVFKNKDFVIERTETEYRQFRLFVNESSANHYKEDLVERGDFRPSEIKIDKINLVELLNYVKTIKYEHPYRLMLTYCPNGGIIQDELRDSNSLVN